LEQFGEDERKFEFNDVTKLSETANVDLIRIHVGFLIGNFALTTVLMIFDQDIASGISLVPMLIYLGVWMQNPSVFYVHLFNEVSHNRLVDQAKELEVNQSYPKRLEDIIETETVSESEKNLLKTYATSLTDKFDEEY
jgi:hypothetical protein